MKTFTPEQSYAAYDLLIRLAGAKPDERHMFVRTLLENEYSMLEYRFRGLLGQGGKFKANAGRPTPYVDFYPEDLTPEREAVIARTNEALEALFTFPAPEAARPAR